MRLRTKFALVLMVAMVVLNSVMFGSVELFKDQTLSQEREDVRQAAQRAAEQVEATLKARRDYVRFYAAQPRVREFGNARSVLTEFTNSPRFVSGHVVASNGTVVGYYNEIAPGRRGAMVGRDLSNQAYVRQALNGKTYIRPIERRQNRYVVLISAPILRVVDDGGSRETEVVGAFVGGFAIRLDDDGSVRDTSRLFGGARALETAAQSVSIRGQRIGGEQTTLKSPDRNFGEAIEATSVVQPVGWTLRVRRDRSGLSARLEWLRLVQGASILLILGTISAVGLWEYRTNLQQTHRLLEGFDALSAGEFDHELSLASAEEWERIAEGFNELSGELSEREQAIREREQRLSVLNRVLRHNLQNDLTVLRGHTAMLTEAPQEQIDESVEAMIEKIDRLVSHSRTARKIEEAMEAAENGVQEVDAASTAEWASDNVEGEYPDAEIDVETDGQQPVWAISVLGAAVEALTKNAVEHTGDDAEVVVSVTRDGDEVSITVADDGPGIPEHERAVLGQEEETSLQHGSGLGLWLAHWIAEKSGGELTFGDQEAGGEATIVLSSTDVDRETVEARQPVVAE